MPRQRSALKVSQLQREKRIPAKKQNCAILNSYEMAKLIMYL